MEMLATEGEDWLGKVVLNVQNSFKQMEGHFVCS